MPVEEAADTLAEDVHGNTRQANNQLNSAQGLEDGPRVGLVVEKPFVSLESEGKTEEVLEDDHASEALDGHIAISIHDVQGPSNSTDDHTCDLEAKEHERDGPGKLAKEHAVDGDAEPVEPHDTEDELRDDALLVPGL